MTRSRKSLRLFALLCGVAGLTGGIALVGLSPAAAEEVAVTAVAASANDGNLPANAIDNDLSTRWSADGDGQWIQFTLAAPRRVNAVALAWYVGNTRSTLFDIDVSLDGAAWTRLGTNLRSSGTTLALETYNVTRPTPAT
ncbi:MAG TPA: discoidin domain-containing protein [Candidatus Limnocylindrales bacterium]